jgi:hypothetical protein
VIFQCGIILHFPKGKQVMEISQLAIYISPCKVFEFFVFFFFFSYCAIGIHFMFWAKSFYQIATLETMLTVAGVPFIF